MEPSPVSAALALARAGDSQGAGAILSALMIEELPSLGTATVAVNNDRYSLNSLNGTVTQADGTTSFFKLHVEEGEERTVQEYYRAELLHRAGWPVERPWFASTTPGRQFLLYRFQHHERLADAARHAEVYLGESYETLVSAQQVLDKLIGAQMIASIHQAPAGASEREPVHQLFHHRLVDPESPTRLGGRAKRFYEGSQFVFPNSVVLGWDEMAGMPWRVNGVLLGHSWAELLDESRTVLDPMALATHGAVIAHGDDHNANVWLTPDGLRLFDPAFAGEHLPALLAQVKATFHNIWAHPFWLYDADLSEATWRVSAAVGDGVLDIDTDWAPGGLRSGFLASKADHVWRPLLAELKRQKWLPDDWERVVRCALFCCPSLVLDLRSRGPRTNALGMAVAMMMGSPGYDQPTFVDDWLNAIRP